MLVILGNYCRIINIIKKVLYSFFILFTALSTKIDGLEIEYNSD